MNKRDEENDVEMGEEQMAMLERELTVAESLKEALEEMELMRKGKLPKKSWREMMKEIREDNARPG